MENFTVKCVRDYTGAFTEGKTYEVINGKILLRAGVFFEDSDGRRYNNVYEINSFMFSRFELVRKDFKQSDLKTGMIVEHRNGTKGMILKGTELEDVIIYGANGGFDRLKDWTEFRIHENKTDPDDIVRVYSSTEPYQLNQSFWEDTKVVAWEE